MNFHAKTFSGGDFEPSFPPGGETVHSLLPLGVFQRKSLRSPELILHRREVTCSKNSAG